MANDRIRIAALWKKQGQKGAFLSGSLSQGVKLVKDGEEIEFTDLIVFDNGYKDSERSPDLIVYAQPPMQKRDPHSRPPQKRPTMPSNRQGQPTLPTPDDDDIPF